MSDMQMQNLICGGQWCNVDSLTAQIYSASKQSNTTFIGRPATSWLDDYIDWSSTPGCCKYFEANESFCPHQGKVILSTNFYLKYLLKILLLLVLLDLSKNTKRLLFLIRNIAFYFKNILFNFNFHIKIPELRFFFSVNYNEH